MIANQSLGGRSAFTLIELLVALVVFAIGGLGIVALSALVARQLALGETHTTAALIGRSVLDSLAALPCRTATSGSLRLGGVTVDWTVSDSGDASLVTERVQFPSTRGTRHILTAELLPCE
jgi:prepilin-type N-terminal cleavage/methylation domain-containing protein